MMMLISPSPVSDRSMETAVAEVHLLDSPFQGSRRFRSTRVRTPYVMPELACTSCMSTLTEDALCAACGKPFEP